MTVPVNPDCTVGVHLPEDREVASLQPSALQCLPHTVTGYFGAHTLAPCRFCHICWQLDVLPGTQVGEGAVDGARASETYNSHRLFCGSGT